jgi:hypothetical protein
MDIKIGLGRAIGFLRLAAGTVTVCLAGCGVAAPVAEEALSEQASPVLSTSWTDGSGNVLIALFRGNWSATAERNQATASVDAGYTLVGGGAEISGGLATPGALLTGAEPLSFTTFRAASKDHYYVYSHQLRAYALGMKIKGTGGTFLTASQLQSEMQIVWTDHPGPQGTPHPDGDLRIDPADIVIGGGAWAHDGHFQDNPPDEPTSDVAWNHSGQLLYSSIWSDIEGWNGSSKDHVYSDPGFIEIAAIVIHRCSRLWTGCLADGHFVHSEYVGTGYQSLSVESAFPWAVTSVSGSSNTSGAGRLLNGLIPYSNNQIQGAAKIITKDHVIADSGLLYTDVHVIQMVSPPCSCSG